MNWNDRYSAKKKKPGGGRVTPKKVTQPAMPGLTRQTPRPTDNSTTQIPSKLKDKFPNKIPDDYPNSIEEFYTKEVKKPLNLYIEKTCPLCNGKGCEPCGDGKVSSQEEENKVLSYHFWVMHGVHELTKVDSINNITEALTKLHKNDYEEYRFDSQFKTQPPLTHYINLVRQMDALSLIPTQENPSSGCEHADNLIKTFGLDRKSVSLTYDHISLLRHLKTDHGIEFFDSEHGKAAIDLTARQTMSDPDLGKGMSRADRRKFELIKQRSDSFDLGSRALRAQSIFTGDGLENLSSEFNSIHTHIHKIYTKTGYTLGKEDIINLLQGSMRPLVTHNTIMATVLNEGLTVAKPDQKIIQHLRLPIHNW